MQDFFCPYSVTLSIKYICSRNFVVKWIMAVHLIWRFGVPLPIHCTRTVCWIAFTLPVILYDLCRMTRLKVSLVYNDIVVWVSINAKYTPRHLSEVIQARSSHWRPCSMHAVLKASSTESHASLGCPCNLKIESIHLQLQSDKIVFDKVSPKPDRLTTCYLIQLQSCTHLKICAIVIKIYPLAILCNQM